MAVDRTLLIVHGYDADSRHNWYPWLKTAAKKRGYHVLLPDLSPNEAPSPQRWLQTLLALRPSIRGELFIVAHSAGAIASCQFLERAGVAASKFILVAPLSHRPLRWITLRALGYTAQDKRIIVPFMRQTIDWDKVRAAVGETVLYLSSNDPVIPRAVRNDYEVLEPRVYILRRRFHFSERTGNVQLPEVLDVLPLN